MSLSTVTTGQAISHTDIDQVINVLQQPSGGQEKGKYWIAGNTYTSGAYDGQIIITLSRVSVPVSNSIDSADQAPSGFNAPAVLDTISSYFMVYATGTGANTNNNVGGNYTIQY